MIHVVHVMRTLGHGGMEKNLRRVALALEPRGIRHSILLLSERTDLLQFPTTIPVRRVITAPRDPRMILRLARHLYLLKPTVIHARNWATWPDTAFARLLGAPSTPLIFSYHGMDTAEVTPLHRAKFQSMEKITTNLFAVSHAARALLLEKFGLPPKRVGVILNGVDTNKFHPREPNRVPQGLGGTSDVHASSDAAVLRSEHAKNPKGVASGAAIFGSEHAKGPKGVASGAAVFGSEHAAAPEIIAPSGAGVLGAEPLTAPIIIGAVGRLFPIKNFPLLMRATRRLIDRGLDIELRLAGDGPDEAHVKQLRETLNLTTHMTMPGYVEDIATFLQNLDIFALSSDNEANPNALLEAMATAKPCVATNVGGAAEVLAQGRYGLLVPPNNESEMAEALAKLAKDPGLRDRLGQTARAHVTAHYTETAMFDAYERLYRDPHQLW